MASLVRLVGEFRGRLVRLRKASYHRGRAGDTLDDGTGRCAADGVEDVERVWENALHAIFHRTDLKERKNEDSQI